LLPQRTASIFPALKCGKEQLECSYVCR